MPLSETACRFAIAYWTEAGERAARRTANTEAVRHFGRALALLEAEPTAPERAATELKILATLGPAMMNVQRWTQCANLRHRLPSGRL